MRLDQVSREIICKVVYCGPGMSGKTSNLHFIHQRAPRHAVGEMVSIDTESERTLHFDLLPLDLGMIQGYRCRFEFYTVPGQTYYGATRRTVLENADGIVFVADSRRDMLDENVDSLNDLFENLQHHNLPSDLPMVVQYNKQDLPDALTPEQLNPLLNPRAVDWYRATASNGEGVLETMKGISTQVIESISRTHNLLPADTPPPPQQTQQPQQPAAAASPAQQSWIITCHNCQSMLEVPHANPGDVYSCGSCSAPLEVVDGERGITRQPVSTTGGSVQSGGHTQPQQYQAPRQQPPQTTGEETGYSMHALPAPSSQRQSSALHSSVDQGPPSPQSTPSLPNQAFILEGFQSVAQLDESLLGKRFRIRDMQRSRFLRAIVLNPAVIRQPGFQQNLEPAQNIAAGIRHEHFLSLEGRSSRDDNIVLMYADAPDHEPLSHVLARRQQLQVPQALALIRQVVLALDAASRNGALHGWIRPDVILLSPEGKVLLDEMGIPKPHAFLVRESMGASAATEHYLAPEHLLNESPSDIRTDMFMVGAVLFRMLCGEGLVTGYSANEALHKASATGCRSVRSANPQIPRDVDQFVSQLTAIDRKDRFQSYAAVLNSIDSLMGNRGGTLKLTRSVPASGSIRRTSHGSKGHRRHNATGSLHSGTRRTTGTGPIATGHVRHTTNRHIHHKKKSNVGLILALVVLVAIALIAAFVVATHRPAPQPTAASDSDTSSTPSPTVTTTTPAAQAEPEVEPTPPVTQVAPEIPPASTTPEPTPVTNAPTAPTEEQLNEARIAEAKATIQTYLSNKDDRDLLKQALIALDELKPLDRRSWVKLRAAVNESLPLNIDLASLTAEVEAETEAATAAEPETPELPAISAEQVATLEELIGAERFGEATKQLQTWEIASTDSDTWTATITQGHSDARSRIQREVFAAGNESDALNILSPAIDAWGMPGDEDWADAILSSVIANSENAPTTEDPTGPVVGSDDNIADESELSPNGYSTAALRIDEQIDAALAIGDNAAAEKLLTELNPNARETPAIAHKVTLWSRRSSILSEAIADGRPRATITSPIDKAQWDVTGATNDAVQLIQIGRSKMSLSWNKVYRHELGILFGATANDPAARPVELALASVANVIARENAPAVLFSNRATNADYEGAVHLPMLVEMLRDRTIIALFDQADEAIAANDPNQLMTIIEDLSKGDRLNNPTIASKVSELSTIRLDLLAGNNTTIAQAPDLLTFDDSNDREAFSTRTGGWAVAAGAITNTGDGRLARTDAGNATSLTVSMQSGAPSGAITINFRGVKLVLDFGMKTLLLTSPGQRLEPKLYSLVPNLEYVVFMALEADTGKVRVELNQNEPIRIDPGAMTSEVAIAVDTGGVVRIDELEIRRGNKTTADAAAGSNDDQVVLREALGLEPIAAAYKDPNSTNIILPPVAQGQSGIGIPIRDGVRGTRFEVSGTGSLAIGIGTIEGGTPYGPTFNIDLPPTGSDSKTVQVTWSQTHFQVLIEQAGFTPVSTEFELPEAFTHVIVTAGQSAIIGSTPKPIR